MQYKVHCRNNSISETSGSGVEKLTVYVGDAGKLSEHISEYFSLLSDSEKTRAGLFSFESDYNCYVSVHALLRKELAKHLKTDPASVLTASTKNGKPFIPGSDLPFSLTRSGSLFAFVIGIEGQSLGIDIEQLKHLDDFAEISKNYFSGEEHHRIFLNAKIEDQNRNFFEIWTRKEAFLKAIGTGITIELSDVIMLDGTNNITITDVSSADDTYFITTTFFNNALISIASSSHFNLEFVEPGE